MLNKQVFGDSPSPISRITFLGGSVLEYTQLIERKRINIVLSASNCEIIFYCCFILKWILLNILIWTPIRNGLTVIA